MSKQHDAAPARRGPGRMRILAIAGPATATAGLLCSHAVVPARAVAPGPAAAPGNPAVTPIPTATPGNPAVPRPRAATAGGLAVFAGPNDLQGFEPALGVVQPLPAAPRRAKRAHTSRLQMTLRELVRAGDRIARTPYVYGGGHGSFDAAGYDCSGSVSYVLHAAGLLGTPQDSGGLESYGDPGPGRHITIYANAGHALLTIDGRRFDTIAFQETGTRWSSTIGDTSGYVVRHPHGL